MKYETLILEYPQLTVKEVTTLPAGLAGFILGREILLDKRRCKYERHGVLAEELGHFETTHGELTDLSSVRNWKLELVARRWGYEKIVSLDRLIKCRKMGYTTLEEVCTYLEITPEYLQVSLQHYLSRFGTHIVHREHIISFDPFDIKKVEKNLRSKRTFVP